MRIERVPRTRAGGKCSKIAALILSALAAAFAAADAAAGGEGAPRLSSRLSSRLSPKLLPGLSPSDLHKIVELASPVFTPDGKTVIYAASVHNLETDKIVLDLWAVDYKGSAPRPLTKTPDESESAPQVTPDGKWLFYLSDKSGETQVWRMPLAGGAAEQVTELPGGVSDYSVAPDGSQVAVIAEIGKTVANKAKTPPPIVIDRFQFKEDGRDWLDDRRQHLFAVDAATHEAVQIAGGNFDHWLPSWSPDGKWIAFVSKRRGDPDRNMDFDVFIAPPEKNAVIRKISAFEGTDVDPYWESRPQWSPDSTKLVWLQSGEDKWIYYAPWQLTVADLVSGSVKGVARIDRCFFKPRWRDNKTIVSLVEQDRDTWLAEIDSDSGALRYLTSGKRFGYDFALGPEERTVILDGTSERPYELSAVENGLRSLTLHNAWLEERALGETRDISFMSGGVEIHGILTLPADYVPGKRYPAILRLHGGPVYQFSHEFMPDWRIYAANGYAVLAINPRGSSGRGFDFAKAIYAQWGAVDAKDILAGADEIVRMGIADPDRLGIGGWSYGAILTDFVLVSDSRFKAAVSGAGSGNMFGLYGHDQYAREYALELGVPWKNREAYIRNSRPFLEAGRIRTPTLFQCGEKDFNVPCLGAEQMYQALKSNGVETRLIVYPGQNHTLTVPGYLEDRMQRNLDWYGEHLKR